MKSDKKLLNLNYLDYANQVVSKGDYDLPSLSNHKVESIDYIALYTDIAEYHKTLNTCVSFYQYDKFFDGIHGLYNAIYYKEYKLLQKYKDRFKDVKYVISPDYSQFGDVHRIENLYRYFKARVVSLWFQDELNIEVIPNITYGDESYFPYMVEGYEKCEIVALSIKGSFRDFKQKESLVNAVKYCVDNLPNLKQILIYSVNRNDEDVIPIFKYAQNHGIELIIPSNKMKNRNHILSTKE